MHDAPALGLAPHNVREPAFPGDRDPAGIRGLHALERHDAAHVLAGVLSENLVDRVRALVVPARSPVQARSDFRGPSDHSAEGTEDRAVAARCPPLLVRLGVTGNEGLEGLAEVGVKRALVRHGG